MFCIVIQRFDKIEIVEEETLGVAVGVDIYVQETKYKGLYGKLKVQFEALLV